MHDEEKLQIIKISIDEWKSTLSNDVITKNVVRETNNMITFKKLWVLIIYLYSVYKF